MRTLVLATALFLAGATSGLAQSSTASSLTVRTGATAPQQPVIVDGASWRCNADNVCVGTGGQPQPAPRACRRVVAKLGVALTSFTYKGVTLSDEQLTACNASVA